MVTQIIEERFTAQTLLKWRPSELKLVQDWCQMAKVDVSKLLRGVTLAVVRDPVRATQFLNLPAEMVERLLQSELPLVTTQEARKPVKTPKRKAKGRKGANRRAKRP